MKQQCVVCKKNDVTVALHSEGNDASVFYCDVCGTFEISGTLQVMLSQEPANKKLSYALKKRFDNGIKNTINTDNVQYIIQSVEDAEM